MKTTWVLQANLLRRSKDDMARTLSELGIPYVGVNVTPSSPTLGFLSTFPDHKNLIPHGSVSLLRHALRARWKGAFFDTRPFRVDTWLTRRRDMLNKATVLTVRQAEREWAETTGHWHVRPAEGLKLFDGVVLSADELKRWLKNPDSIQSRTGSITSDTEIAISEAQTLKGEWRWFVVKHRIIDGSLYRANGAQLLRHEENPQLLRMAEELAADWLPHDVCVMDTALTSRGLKVTEFNCFNCAGFYAHDTSRVLKCVNDYFATGGDIQEIPLEAHTQGGSANV